MLDHAPAPPAASLFPSQIGGPAARAAAAAASRAPSTDLATAVAIALSRDPSLNPSRASSGALPPQPPRAAATPRSSTSSGAATAPPLLPLPQAPPRVPPTGAAASGTNPSAAAPAPPGYVVELSGGLCLAAFASPGAAVRWGVAMVDDLLDAPWEPELLAHELCEEVGEDLGLCVRRGAGAPWDVPHCRTRV